MLFIAYSHFAFVIYCIILYLLLSYLTYLLLFIIIVTPDRGSGGDHKNQTKYAVLFFAGQGDTVGIPVLRPAEELLRSC